MRLGVRPFRGKDENGAASWAWRLFGDVAYLLNGRLLPEDNFDAEESEVTFAAAGVGQPLAHTLGRVPDRVEVVRADAGGVVYVTARTGTAVTIAATAIGTYRVRLS